MKIYPGQTPKAPIVRPDKPDSVKKNGATPSFERILTQKKEALGVTDTQGVAPAGQLPTGPRIERVQEEALYYAEESLELMGHLKDVLESGAPGMEKALGQIGEVMTERVEGLISLRDELAPHDPLKESVNRVGVQLAVEAYKIQRGDYGGG